MNDSFRYKITKAMETIGLKVIEMKDDENKVEITINNLPIEWQKLMGKIPRNSKDGIEDGLSSFLNLHFKSWTISIPIQDALLSNMCAIFQGTLKSKGNIFSKLTKLLTSLFHRR